MYEYENELNIQRNLNEIFTNSAIMQNKFEDYIRIMNNSKMDIKVKNKIKDVLLPKIRKYSKSIFDFKKRSTIY